MPLDCRIELRHGKKQRRHWKAAATLTGQELSEWMRDTLDYEADRIMQLATTLPE